MIYRMTVSYQHKKETKSTGSGSSGPGSSGRVGVRVIRAKTVEKTQCLEEE